MKFELKVRSSLPKVPAAIRAGVGRAVSEGLRTGEAMAKGRAPVRTGFLRSSIGVQMDSQTSGRLVARAGYATHVEYGTRFMGARPFMRPGAEAAQRHIEQAVKALKVPGV